MKPNRIVKEMQKMADAEAARFQPLPKGTKVKIDQGFDVFTYGIVLSFDTYRRNTAGFTGNYRIQITGGEDLLGDVRNKPSRIGKIITVLYQHVTARWEVNNEN